MAFSTINKSTNFFNTSTYTANASDNAITGVGFQPDWIITKSRTDAYGANIYNSISGVGKFFSAFTNNIEDSSTAKIASFDSDGFTLKNGDNSNYTNLGSGVSWAWKANGASSANTDGTISSTVSANTTSGFSIVKYQGTGANATVGHGLGAVPKMIIFKNLTQVTHWIVYSSELNISTSNCLRLNGSNAAFTESAWNGTRPTTSVFSLGTHNEANNSSGETIAYCFAEVDGFSKFSSFKGNGSTNGTFISTMMKPAFILIKRTDAISDWVIADNKRDSFNVMNKKLFTDNSDIEYTGQNIGDFVSNGIKLRDNATNNYSTNISGATYIYMAFGQPIISNSGVCATAR